jgi:predicted RecB family nuclease
MSSRNPRDFENPECSSPAVVDLFFPKDPDEPGYRNADIDYRLAKNICMSCQFRVECAEWGIQNEVFGMWGGLTPRERQKFRRVRGIKVSDTLSV